MARQIWVSPNGKYKVLVRKFEGDPQIYVGYWEVDKKGNTKSIRYKELPQYVLEKINELKSIASHK